MIHPVIYVSNTAKKFEQPKDLDSLLAETFISIPGTDGGGIKFEVDIILAHRYKGGIFEFLIAIKGRPQHESEFKTSEYLVESD